MSSYQGGGWSSGGWNGGSWSGRSWSDGWGWSGGDGRWSGGAGGGSGDGGGGGYPATAKVTCSFYLSAKGCRNGSSCPFSHEDKKNSLLHKEQSSNTSQGFVAAKNIKKETFITSVPKEHIGAFIGKRGIHMQWLNEWFCGRSHLRMDGGDLYDPGMCRPTGSPSTDELRRFVDGWVASRRAAYTVGAKKT